MDANRAGGRRGSVFPEEVRAHPGGERRRRASFRVLYRERPCLIGVEKENKKLERFHEDIEAGRFLVLIYARRDQESVVRHLMTRRHPEAEFAGVDSHFVNPFTTVRRRRTSGDRVRA